VEQSSVKTANGARVLPIPAHLVPILHREHVRQLALRLAAGNIWQGARDGHVIIVEPFDKPVSPRTLDPEWEVGLQRARLPHRRLHASRHTAASLLNEKGASPATTAAWLGHADGGNLALRVYVQSRNDALTRAATLLNRGT
jgi:integrase